MKNKKPRYTLHYTTIKGTYYYNFDIQGYTTKLSRKCYTMDRNLAMSIATCNLFNTITITAAF